MKCRNLILTICASWLCGNCGLAAGEAQHPPAIDFLVAALRYQEQACGPSLDVRYTVDSINEPTVGTGRWEMRYVRTPETLFLEESVRSFAESGQWALASTQRCAYNRQTKEYRAVGVNARGSGRAGGVIRSGSSVHRFQQNTVLDPVRFPMLLMPLCERLATGRVTSEQEVIDGHACWRIDLPASEAGCVSVAWSVWLDPEVGYCPRRIVESYTGKTGLETTTTSFDGYRSLPGGVWFPTESVADYGNGHGLRIEVQDVFVGKEIPEGELRVDFPAGAKVRVGEDWMILP